MMTFRTLVSWHAPTPKVATGPVPSWAGIWVVIASLSLGLLGCGGATATAPDGKGVTRGEGKQGAGRFLEGTGCVTTTADAAADRLSADERARAEVAKQIEVRVVQLVEDFQKEEKAGGEAVQSYAVSVQTQEMVDRNLKGVAIVERTTDPARGITCSRAVLDKAAMAERVREELDRILSETEAHMASAGTAQQEGRHAEALRASTLALLNLGPASVQAGLLRDLGYRPPPVPSGVQVGKRWMEVLQGIRLSAAGGDRQKGRAGSPLPAPLEVRAVHAGGRPVADLPVTILRAPAGIEVQRTARTDESGRAEFLVFRVPQDRKSLQEIVVGLDWDGLLQGEGGERTDAARQAWDSRETIFTYLLPVPSDYRVGVAVYDQAGNPMDRTALQSAIQEGLQRAGFVTRDIFSMPGEVRQGFLRRPSLPEARRLLEGKVDILVLGDFQQGAPKGSSYDLVFCRSRMIVQGIDLKTGKTLVSVDLNSKGGGLDNDTAVRKSEESLGKILRSEAGERLARSLP